MRAPDGTDDGATHKIRVLLAQHERARVGVDGVGGVEVAEEGGGEQGGDVGVVHEGAGAVAVELVGVDGACAVEDGGVGDDGVGGYGGAEVGGAEGHGGCEGGVGAEGGDDRSGRVEVVGEEHVCGDEELEEGCVVGGAEGGADEACAGGVDGVAEAVVGEGFGGAGGEAGEGVGACVQAAVRGVGWGRHCFGDGHDGVDGG